MTHITDDFMRDMLTKSKPYTVLLLKATPKRHEPGADTIVWLATLPEDGPTGGFFRDRKPIPW